MNRIPRSPESLKALVFFFFKPWGKSSAPLRMWWQRLKLPLRKSNVWISVKADRKPTLKLPQASREEIKTRDGHSRLQEEEQLPWGSRWGPHVMG